MKKIVYILLLIVFFNGYAQRNPIGNYTLTTKIEEIGSGNSISLKFDFYFRRDKAFLRIDTDNSLEAYCEGPYSVKNNKNKLWVLKYTGEGICSDDSRINTIYVKKVNQFFYIKSGRFESNQWLKLKKE